MANAYDDFGFDEKGQPLPYHPVYDQDDPALAGLSDEEKRQAVQPAGNAYSDFTFDEPVAAPVEKPGYTAGNQIRKTADRAGKMLGEMTFGLADTLGDLAPDWMNSGIVWDDKGLRIVSGEEYDKGSLVANIADVLRDPQRQVVEHRDTYTFDDVKNAPDAATMAQRAAVFALENGVASLPDMVAILANAPSYVAGLASQYTQQRAANDGRDKPTLSDAAIGTGTAAVVSALEKFGAERVLGALGGGGKGAFMRFLTGAAAEAGTEAAQNPAEVLGTTVGTEAAPATSGERLQALSDSALSGALGGLGGGIAVGGPAHIVQAIAGQSKPEAGPLQDAANAKPEISIIEEAQQKARQEVAARGGDNLDQEVAAALAAAEVTAQRRGAQDVTARQVREAQRQLKVESDYAIGTAQSEEDNARAQIQAEAAARYEQGIPAPPAAPLEVVKTTPEVRVKATPVSEAVTRKPAQPAVAQVAASEAAARKDADYTKALQQRDTEVATQQEFEGEPARASIAEIAGPPKTLAERRARNTNTKVGISEQVPTDVDTNRATSEQMARKVPALPAPKTARFEVNQEGAARPVSEAEVEQRQAEAKGPPMREGLAVKEDARAFLQAPAREVAPRTLAERRAEIAAEKQRIEAAAAEAASSPKNDLAEPSQAQRDAGNYKKGHLKLHGMDISIETPKGGLRTFKGGTGSRRMRDHYGYVRRTEGADGDQVDVFIGDQPDSQKVYVVDQVKQEDGSFDEHKALVGYPSEEAAVAAYKRNYQSDWKVGPVTEMSVGEFKKWAQEGDTKSPLKPDALRVRRVAATPRRKIGDDGRLAEGDVTVRPLTKAEFGRSAVRAENESAGERDGGGFITAVRRGGRLQVTASHVPENLRGQRRGIAMLEKLAEQAETDGTPLVSDTVVSKDAQRLYDALERRGYTVKRNPEVDTGDDGALISQNTRPVFEVSRPEKAESAPRAAAGRLRETAPKRSQTTTAPKKSKGVPLTEAQAVLKPLLDEIGTDGNAVLRNASEMPQAVREKAYAEHGKDRVDSARGYYDPATETTYVFADNHSTTDRVIQTALHEIVAHRGVRKLLGKDYGSTMRDVFKGAKERAWLTDFMEQHELNPEDAGHQTIAADEYIASIAERGTDLTTWEKIVTAIRAVLRKLGVVDKWTDADIRRLLVRSRSGLREASMHGRDTGPYGGRLAPGDLKQPKTSNTHPNTRLFKMNVTAEDQANYNPGFVRSRLDAIRDGGENAIPAALALIPRRNLPDFMSPAKMPSMKAYVRAAQRMDGRRSELLQAADDTASRWLKYVSKNKDQARILGELMHAATLATVDPANAFQPLYTGKNRRGNPIPLTPEQAATEAQRRGQYNALRRHWNALAPEAKAIYIEVRDAYARQRDLTQQGLEARINQAQADGKTKQALVAALREKFESGRVAGPYFPLARFGNHWASAKDKNGNVVAFSRFEKPSEQRAWKAEMARAGYAVDSGVKPNDADIAKRIDPGFVAKIASMLDEIDPSMADDVWQQYLRALPEMSMRKHFIHRKGRLGFTADALRAFAFQQFHGAHQIAKLEHMAVMDSLVEQIAIEADGLRNTTEEKWAAGLRDEFALRHKWAKQPQSSLWATRLTGLGFAFYLGLTPAAAIVNLTQTAIVGMPTLAARFNWLGAGTELTRAAALYAGSRGPLVNRLRGDEQKAFEEAKRVGLFDKTQAHDLAGLGEEGSTDYGSTRQKVSNIISWMFHKTEEANRQVTFLAAYRLSRRKGRNHEAAILEAEELTWDSHFDYANVNRPRVLQGDTAKVMFLFRQYSLNMTYRLARDFNDSLRGATPAVKHEARTRFAGILGQTFLFAGASGLPLFWLVKLVCNSLFGDDDEPFDTEGAMRAGLAQALGPRWSQAITDGPVSAISGADISSRVGLNNLWMREPPPGTEGVDLGMFYLKEVAGPLPAMGVAAFEAAALDTQGYGDRAAEKLAPKALSDAFKMLRYAREGVTSKRGDELVSPEEISTYELFLQGLGFVPSDVALQYDQNRIVKAAEQAIVDRRVFLMNRLALATQNDDSQGWTDALADIQKFNSKNPGLAIDGPAIFASAKARARYSAEAVNGVRVEPGLRYLHDELNFTEEKEDVPTPP